MASPSNPVFPSPPTSWLLPPPPPSSAPAASSEKKETLLVEQVRLLQQALRSRDSILTDDVNLPPDVDTCLALRRFATFDVPAGLVLRLLASTIVGDGEGLTLCFMKGEKAAEIVCSLKEENDNVVHSSVIPVISTCVGVFMRDSVLKNPAKPFTFPTLVCADGCCMIDRGMGKYGYPSEIHELLYYAERYAKQLLKPETAAIIVATGSGTQAPGVLPQPAAFQKVRASNQGEGKRRRGSDDEEEEEEEEEEDRVNRRRRRQVDIVFPRHSKSGMEVYWRDLVGDGIVRYLGHIQGVPTMENYQQLDQAVNHLLTQFDRPTQRTKEYYSYWSTQRMDVLVVGETAWEHFRAQVIGVHVHAEEGDVLPGEAEAVRDELEGVTLEEMGDNFLNNF